MRTIHCFDCFHLNGQQPSVKTIQVPPAPSQKYQDKDQEDVPVEIGLDRAVALIDDLHEILGAIRMKKWKDVFDNSENNLLTIKLIFKQGLISLHEWYLAWFTDSQETERKEASMSFSYWQSSRSIFIAANVGRRQGSELKQHSATIFLQNYYCPFKRNFHDETLRLTFYPERC